MPDTDYKPEPLARCVRSKRELEGCSLRQAAREMGVSPSTLSRIENYKTPDMDTFLKICGWMDIPPRNFLP